MKKQLHGDLEIKSLTENENQTNSAANNEEKEKAKKPESIPEPSPVIIKPGPFNENNPKKQ